MDEGALLAELESRQGSMIEMRRDLHMHPETAFQEHRTAGIVAERLRAAGLEVRTGLGETGIVGVVRGGQPGPVVLVRPDMDALPVQERNDLPFRSRVDGKMHACGHDGHTAVGIALAEALAARRDALPGAVVFAFQPAEEIVSGARPMIEQGTLVAREVAAVDKAVVSIGTFHAGTAFNILPPEAQLSGTLRTLDAELRERLSRRIGEVAQGIAATLRAEAEYRFQPGCPPVVNQ